MSKVWDTLIEIEKLFESEFYATGSIIHEPWMHRFNQPGWINKVWASSQYRRAHIDVVDARESKGLWMMHCCVFPHLHNPAPIFGFDVIAGKNKITGCFMDFSPAGDSEHPLIDWFAAEAQKLQWNKTRKLPDWAERIFTGSMIAAGNVKDIAELNQICDIALGNLHNYLARIGTYSGDSSRDDVIEAQNYYCEHQQMNPHTPRVMESLGLPEEDIKLFCSDNLFPKIV